MNDAELLLQVIRYRISHWAVPDSFISQRILLQIEAQYNRGIKIFKSPEYNLHDGMTAAIPWSEKLTEFKVVLYYIDDRLKMELGEARYVIPTNYQGFSSAEGGRNRVLLDIFPNGATEKIAKILCNLCVHRSYAGSDEDHIAEPERRSRDIFHKPIPGFRFKRLSKAINWDRLRHVDVRRIMETTDVRSVLAFLDDVAFGDAAEEDAEPVIVKGLQLTQFTAQYLLCSKEVMKEKSNMIHDALKTFQKEEDLLDLKIAKLKARNKAMKRELSEMDRLADNYHMALKKLEPQLKDRIKREKAISLKEKLKDVFIDKADVASSSEGDEVHTTSKLKSKLITTKSKSSSARDLIKKDQFDKASSANWKNASLIPGTMNRMESWSSGNGTEMEELEIEKPLYPLETNNLKVNDRWNANQDVEGKDSLKSKLEKKSTKTSAGDKHDMISVTSKDTLPNTTSGRTIPKFQVTLPVDPNDFAPVETQHINDRSRAHHSSMSTLVVETTDRTNSENSDARNSIPNLTDMNLPIQNNTHEDPFSRQKSSTSFSTGAMSLDSLAKTSNSIQMTSSMAPTHPISSSTTDIANNLRPTMNTWTPSSSHSSKLFIKGKYGAQYLDDEEDVETTGIPLHKTVPFSNTASSKPSLSKITDEAKVVTGDDDSLLTTGTVSKPGMLKRLDTTFSSAGENSSQYNDTFESPDYKRDPYSIHDESLIYSDSKQWYGESKAESKRNGSRHLSNKGVVDDSTMSISADSDPMPHLRMLDSSKLNSIVGNNSTDAFISSTDDSSHLTKLTTTTTAQSNQGLIRQTSDDGHHLVDTNNGTGDSSSMFAAIDTSKSLIIELDLPGGMDDHQDSSYNGGESSITMSQPNTYSTKGTPYGFANTNINRFRKFDDFDVDDQDEMNLGTLNKVSIAASNNFGKKVDIEGNSSLVKGHDDDVMNISEGSSSLNYTTTTYSAPPTREFASDYSYQGNYSPNSNSLNNNDDMVLMGTAKFAIAGNGDTMEKDSLAGTMESNINAGGASGSIGGGAAENILQSNDSFSFNKLNIRDSGPDLRFGSTLDSDNKNISFGSTPYTNNSSAFESSRQGSEYSNDNTFVSDPNYTRGSLDTGNLRDSVNQSDLVRVSVDTASSSSELTWKLGRAPLDLIELAQAFEVHLSAVSFSTSIRTVVADLEFLDVKSPKSHVVRINMSNSFQPVSFSAHLIFNEDTENILREEIAEIGDSMTFQINFYSAHDDKLVGQAVVELWVMIEDCCNIVRKEIDIYTVDMSSVIGTAVVDVKGYSILIRCAE